MRRFLVLSFALALVACSGGDASTSEDEAPTNPSTTATEQADNDGSESSLSPAEKLASDVLEKAGADDLSQAKEVEFTFVVSTKGEEVFRAHHRFNRVANTDRITWINPDSPVGKRFDLLIDLDDNHVDGKVDGVPITDTQREQVRPLAHQRWVNDYYWYAMPLKLRDPGVQLEKLPQREWKGQTYDVLEMTFSGVGLTPGDRYVLYIQPELDRIERWDMDLESSDGEPVAVARTNFEQVGPLYLSHDHVWINGDKRVDIRNVDVSDTVQTKEFEFDDSDFSFDAFPRLDADGEPIEQSGAETDESSGKDRPK